MKRDYIQDVQAKLEQLSSQMLIEPLAYVGSRRTRYPVYYINTGSGNKKVLLSAGIHGDEPAGVYALIEFLQEKIRDYTDSINFSIFPCLNPWGFVNDTRYNLNGIDINRCFVRNTSRTAIILKNHVKARSGYLFALNMHEDNTNLQVGETPKEMNPKGFYLYETPMNGIGTLIVHGLDNKGINICKDSEICKETNRGGVILPNSTDGEFEQFLKPHARLVIETETPTCWPLEERVRVQSEALHIALNSIRRE